MEEGVQKQRNVSLGREGVKTPGISNGPGKIPILLTTLAFSIEYLCC